MRILSLSSFGKCWNRKVGNGGGSAGSMIVWSEVSGDFIIRLTLRVQMSLYSILCVMVVAFGLFVFGEEKPIDARPKNYIRAEDSEQWS